MSVARPENLVEAKDRAFPMSIVSGTHFGEDPNKNVQT